MKYRDQNRPNAASATFKHFSWPVRHLIGCKMCKSCEGTMLHLPLEQKIGSLSPFVNLISRMIF